MQVQDGAAVPARRSSLSSVRVPADAMRSPGRPVRCRRASMSGPLRHIRWRRRGQPAPEGTLRGSTGAGPARRHRGWCPGWRPSDRTVRRWRQAHGLHRPIGPGPSACRAPPDVSDVSKDQSRRNRSVCSRDRTGVGANPRNRIACGSGGKFRRRASAPASKNEGRHRRSGCNQGTSGRARAASRGAVGVRHRPEPAAGPALRPPDPSGERCRRAADPGPAGTGRSAARQDVRLSFDFP